MDILVTWFLRHGGILHEGVELVHGSQGYYLCSGAEINLAVDSLIISCPHKLTISWLNAKECLPEKFINATVPYISTRFFLIQQRLLCGSSFWWPYIQALPGPTQECLHTPMWYSMDDLLWIKGTNLEAAVSHRSEKWRQEYEEGIRLLGLSERQRKEWTWFVVFNLDVTALLELDLGSYTCGQRLCYLLDASPALQLGYSLSIRFYFLPLTLRIIIQ